MEGLVRDLSDAVEERIRNAFDLSRISKEIVAKGGLARVETPFLAKHGHEFRTSASLAGIAVQVACAYRTNEHHCASICSCAVDENRVTC